MKQSIQDQIKKLYSELEINLQEKFDNKLGDLENQKFGYFFLGYFCGKKNDLDYIDKLFPVIQQIQQQQINQKQIKKNGVKNNKQDEDSNGNSNSKQKSQFLQVPQSNVQKKQWKFPKKKSSQELSASNSEQEQAEGNKKLVKKNNNNQDNNKNDLQSKIEQNRQVFKKKVVVRNQSRSRSRSNSPKMSQIEKRVQQFKLKQQQQLKQKQQEEQNQNQKQQQLFKNKKNNIGKSYSKHENMLYTQTQQLMEEEDEFEQNQNQNNNNNYMQTLLINNTQIEQEDEQEEEEVKIEVEQEREFQRLKRLKQQQQEEEEMNMKLIIELQEQEEKELKEQQKKQQEVQEESNTCKICLDDLLPTGENEEMQEVIPLQNCEHIFHKECILGYIKNMIDNRKVQFKCPEEKCGKDILISDFKDVIEKKSYDKYLEYSLATYVDDNAEKATWCPTPDCRNIFLLNERKENNRFKCPSCKVEYCLNCRVDYNKGHKGMTCKEFQVSKHKDKNDVKFEKYVKNKNYKQCPHCKFWVSRVNGCFDIICKCGHSFCYVCGGPTESHHCPNCGGEGDDEQPSDGYDDGDDDSY